MFEVLMRGSGPTTPPVRPQFKISADTNIQNEEPAWDVDGTARETCL